MGAKRMEKAEILNRIRNRLTLPRAVLQTLMQMNPQYEMAIQDMDELIKEIENPPKKTGEACGGTKDENPNDRSL